MNILAQMDLFRDEIEILANTGTITVAGGSRPAWTRAGTVKGRIFSIAGTRLQLAGKVTVRTTDRLECLPCALTTANRVKLGGLVYRIIFVHRINSFDPYIQADLECTGHDS